MFVQLAFLDLSRSLVIWIHVGCLAGLSGQRFRRLRCPRCSFVLDTTWKQHQSVHCSAHSSRNRGNTNRKHVDAFALMYVTDDCCVVRENTKILSKTQTGEKQELQDKTKTVTGNDSRVQFLAGNGPSSRTKGTYLACYLASQVTSKDAGPHCRSSSIKNRFICYLLCSVLSVAVTL